ncbi:putative membrane protein [Thermoanaerobacter kivui]|uniref:Putative membrane protein n=1 Tax=Thermoanaerobacter kivui TaxID=2325 RepID=A0A097AR66_THEKI|nr:TIGR04086 family membrane protein [Thermoanaerobacter kivui]AIS52310.1 putative membrane protein [Thermoanaerobacter kivui]
MKGKFQLHNDKNINVQGILIGVLVAYIITLSFFIVYALLLTFTALSELTLPTLTMLITIIGIVLSGALSARHTTSKGWLNGGIAGILYVTIMLVLGAFFVEELGPASSWTVKYVWGAVLGALGGMIGINL